MFRKGSILWVIFVDGDSSFFFERKFNCGLIQKRSQFFESNGWKKVQFFESSAKKVQLFQSNSKRCSTLWVIFCEKFCSLSRIDQRRVQFESCQKVIHTEERFNSLSILKKFNSLSHIGKQERFNSSRHIEKKDFNSLSHIGKRFIKRGSILWVFYKESHSWSLFLTHGSILWVIFLDQMFQFFASSERKRCSFLCVIFREKSSILCVILKEKGFNPLRRIQRKRVQLFAYMKKKDWNLWLVFKNSILWVILRKHPFFDSY